MKIKRVEKSFLIGEKYFPANLEYQNDFPAWQFLFSKMFERKIPFEKLLLAVQKGARLNRAGELDLTHFTADLDLQVEFDSIPTNLLEQAAKMVVLDKTLKKTDSIKILRQTEKVKEVESDPADDFPIFTATLKELEFWHACVNCHIQNFLRDYDLSSGSKAYDSFKIGVDEQVHALTFALDDTHYLKIDLTDNNFRPIDMEQAEKVLRKVNDLRFAQNKKLSRRYEVIREIPI